MKLLIDAMSTTVPDFFNTVSIKSGFPDAHHSQSDDISS